MFSTRGELSENVLEKMQPTPVPFLVNESQQARVLGALQVGEVAPEAGAGLGRAYAVMATERTLRMVLYCILVVWGRLEACGLGAVFFKEFSCRCKGFVDCRRG